MGQSNFLNNLGMGSFDIGYFFLIFSILFFVLIVVCVVLSIELGQLKKRYLRFSQGRDAKSLEKEIGSIFSENAKLRELTERNRKDIKVLYRKTEKTFQKVGLVKYDAFGQMGGKLSFSLALLDEMNNGFIINSVHGTDGCYTYTKEIKGGACELALGDEEEKALDIAMQN